MIPTSEAIPHAGESAPSRTAHIPIRSVEVTRFTHMFRTCVDSDGHAHPGPPREARAALLTITAEDSTAGRIVTGTSDLAEGPIAAYVRPTLVGADPCRPEALWHLLYKMQRGSRMMLTDRMLCAVELALWDLFGKLSGQPVWKMLGGARARVPTYGSTMCGDDIEGGLATPEDYGRFADWLVTERGYRGVKLHTWMPPLPGAPNVQADYRACAAVREAVGPDVPLMLDPNHWYSRADSFWLAERLAGLGFLWMEECMEEASMSSYRWLREKVPGLQILGPETMAGKHWTRAEWAMSGACDMLRTGVWDVGGIGPAMKTAHLADSLHMSCEVHGTGAGNLAICAAMANDSFYERGLLHPHVDYEAPADYELAIDDPMDEEGYVTLSERPGLGHSLDLEHIAAHAL